MAMNAEALIGAVHHFKDGKIAVTFNRGGEGIAALRRLSRAYCGPNKPVQIDQHDQLLVGAICASGDWDGDKNRTIKFTGLHTLDDNTLTQFARDIEKIAV